MPLPVLNHIIAPLVDLLFPHQCEYCQAPAQQWLCTKCQGELEELADGPQCPRCAYPLAGEGDPCPFCLGKRPFGKVAALAIYKEPLRQLIHRFKYQGRWRLAQPLARHLLNKKHAQNILAQAEVIVPVPLFWRRRMARGFNQAELLARIVAREHHLPLVRAISRIRNTPHANNAGVGDRTSPEYARGISSSNYSRPGGEKSSPGG